MRSKLGQALVLLGLWLGASGPGQATETVVYYHTDALGSPVAVTDAGGAVIERSQYEPYGKLLNRPLADGPGYTGHVSDAATGLGYMQQRYYDPASGRFLSVDPVSVDGTTGWNFCRYCYANNSPYKFTDPDGRTVVCESSRACQVVANEMKLSPVIAKFYSQLYHSKSNWVIASAKLTEHSNVTADDPKKGRVQADGSASEGSGGRITLLLGNKEPKEEFQMPDGSTEKQKPSDGEIIAHEFRHGVDNDSGVMPPDGVYNDQGNELDEQNAIDSQNEYRDEQQIEGHRENF